MTVQALQAPARGGVAGRLLAVGHVVVRLPAMLLVVLFRVWQLLVSPTYGDVCRFYPSCSAYGVEAVRTHGAVRGGWFAVRRVARCHPWNPGGVDPVPPASGRRAAERARATSGSAPDEGLSPRRPAA